ncbi:hypothetical protein Dimus_022347 [Dionaea muscipula]
MTVIHLKKKDIVKSKVRGIEMEFDHDKSAIIPVVIDEATTEGESGSDDQFYDARVEVEEPMMKLQQTPAAPTSSPISAEGTRYLQSRPSGHTAQKPNFEIPSEFERKRANRFHDDLEKAKAENAGLQPYSPSPIQIQPLDFLA